MNDKEITALRAAVNVLQGLLPHQPATRQEDAEPVHRFVRAYLVPDTTQSVTTAEITAYYVELANLGHVQPLPALVLQRRLGPAILKAFGIRRTHNVVRDDKQRRGFRGLGFASATV